MGAMRRSFLSRTGMPSRPDVELLLYEAEVSTPSEMRSRPLTHGAYVSQLDGFRAMGTHRIAPDEPGVQVSYRPHAQRSLSLSRLCTRNKHGRVKHVFQSSACVDQGIRHDGI